jgi:phenylpyruvate tautomerase PptA (4-oxalocrotonate tautomerase family)
VPMFELSTTRGALDDGTKQRLAEELATIALELEAAPFARFGDQAHMQALAWCFVNEMDVFVGGQVIDKPIYRVVVTIPEGAPGVFGPLAWRGRQRLVERVTDAVLAAEGSEPSTTAAHRVWVHLRHVVDGHWGAFREIVTLPDIADYGMKVGEPGSNTARWRDAAMESVEPVSAAWER